ncbi:hypothetical protein [Actinorugispora endophytica]|uniref:Uncharacterized protein n=1 Tax=Actinorugispora endophytica TaxID=1605990 RepID=A0A4R6V2F7_9ACTN|nr:hypothetical protein [Actinorugispora endophytica]TDQ54354.1 hypothetical protein EV190_102188 [Actinorugispora endophytica]
MRKTTSAPAPAPNPTDEAEAGGHARFPRLAAALARRWPTWLAVAFAAVVLVDLDDGRGFAAVLLIAALGYLATAVIDRPGAIWGVIAGLVALLALVRTWDVDPWLLLAPLALLLVVAGLVRGQLRRPGLFALQTPALLAFGAIALGAPHVPPGLGHLLVAAGLLGHAAWDAVHWRSGRVVARPFAEWCGVLDLLLGVAVLLLAAATRL